MSAIGAVISTQSSSTRTKAEESNNHRQKLLSIEEEYANYHDDFLNMANIFPENGLLSSRVYIYR